MKNLKFLFIIYLILIHFLGCKNLENEPIAAVVSARKEASDIGIAIMAKGGNAFDAMIATDLALSVCYPNAGNLAGGGFFVFRKENGEKGSLDYREKASENAQKNMFLDNEGNIIPEKSTLGGLAVGVPGTVAGLFEIYKKMATLPWEALVQPAIDLAEKGFVVTKKQENSLNSKREDFIKINGKETFYGNTFKVGDTIKNHAIASTLKIIQKEGKNGFYEGKIAKLIVDKVKKTGGIISLNDMKNYSPVWRDLINFQYKDLNVFSMGPPSSGGICLGQIMKMIEPFSIQKYNHNSLKYIQLLTEAQRRSYADRSEFLGDPDFNNIPQNELISNEYLKSRMNNFSFNKATSSSDINFGNVYMNESDETTHYSIIDTEGNAVAVTTTLNAGYGSKVYVEKGGFFLNNEMDDFSSKPGTPNMFGLVGSEANSIQAKKRMLSSMTPTIIEKNGKTSMIVGTPGGSTIITSVLQTILNVYEFQMNIQEAVNAPRFHHQWLPDEIRLEPGNFDHLIKDLLKKGYFIKPEKELIGRVDALHVNSKGIIKAGADPRGDDYASFLY
ncbi:MAG: gamma-glutamyltransferase [Flavobacteriaceae bacterium]|nr:gamma-glutamyltransferase [Flavobacteriaceae bacterium]